VLCEYTEAVATRLHVLAPKIVLLGGLFQRDSIYNHAFRRRLKKALPDARVANSERAPEFGAAWLAAELQSWPEIQAEPAPEKIDDLAATNRTTQPALRKSRKDERARSGEAFRRRRKICWRS